LSINFIPAPDLNPELLKGEHWAYLMFHSLGENVLVEATREVALQQLVVIDCLGNHSPHKLEVIQVVRVDV
jgi:hypothetical protein